VYLKSAVAVSGAVESQQAGTLLVVPGSGIGSVASGEHFQPSRRPIWKTTAG
jgi:hypothetical protein